MSVLVECEGLKKRFGRKEAVRGIDLEIEEHDVFGLIGPNGAGKSTLIKMMTGLIWPDEGSVTINGYDVHNEHSKAMENVGAIIEWPSFIPYLSARENLEMLSGGCGEDFQRELAEVVAFVNMTANLDRKIGNFSTGMKQRMGIALSLIPQSKFVILDEPTNGLDPNGITEIRQIISERNKKFGTTILLCSHLLGEIESVCNKMAIVHDGQIALAGPIDELLNTNGRILVRTDNNLKAVDIIKDSFPQTIGLTIPSEKKDEIYIDTGEDIAADINSSLVGQGVRVSHISYVKPSLEEFFNDVTGGQTDV